MTIQDENYLHHEYAEGRRAQELIENELLAAAFSTLEQQYVSAWRSTAIDNVAAREKLFVAINVIGKVRDHLAAVVANGRLAEVELTQFAQASGRRRRVDTI